MKKTIFLLVLSSIFGIGIYMLPINSQNQMDIRNKFEILISLPWGDEMQAIKPKLLDYPNFSNITLKQVRKIHAPLRIKLDASKGVHILNDNKDNIQNDNNIFITHFTSSGIWNNKTHIAKNGSDLQERIIVDFVVDRESNCYLLEKIKTNNYYHNSLIKTNVLGELLWQTEGSYSPELHDFRKLQGEFNKLFIDNQTQLYLTSANQPNSIAKINAANGNISIVYSLEKASNDIFVNDQGTILSPIYFPEQNRRGLFAFYPAFDREEFVIGNEELYGLLLYPFGVDNRSNFYIYKLPSLNPIPAIVKISFDGRILREQKIKDLVVSDNGNAIYSHYFHNSRLEITEYRSSNVQHWSLTLPEKYSTDKSAIYKLIKVDENLNFYFLAGESPGQSGKMLKFSKTGYLEEQIYHSSDLLSLESSLQSFSYWQVDSEGNIYFPISEPSGFKLIKMRLT